MTKTNNNLVEKNNSPFVRLKKKKLRIIMQLLYYFKGRIDHKLLEDSVLISANSGRNSCREGFTEEVIVEAGLVH